MTSTKIVERLGLIWLATFMICVNVYLPWQAYEAFKLLVYTDSEPVRWLVLFVFCMLAWPSINALAYAIMLKFKEDEQIYASRGDSSVLDNSTHDDACYCMLCHPLRIAENEERRRVKREEEARSTPLEHPDTCMCRICIDMRFTGSLIKAAKMNAPYEDPGRHPGHCICNDCNKGTGRV